MNKYINVTSIDSLADHGINRIAIAIGVFDGVHLGHQSLLEELMQMSGQEDAIPVVLTFYPHPRQILEPENCPALLFSPDKKIEFLYQYGAKAVVTVPFTKEFASLTPQKFINCYLLTQRIELKGICVGKNWRFGAGGTGAIKILEELAEKGHFRFKAVDELNLDDTIISSTVIRRAISAGRLQEAEKMLGRHYLLTGTVEEGKKIAGPTLTCPTANLKFKYGILPPRGVYAGRACHKGKKYPAAIAIGTSPTFSHSINLKSHIEVHIMDFSDNIYGQDLEIELIEYIREERCYSSAEILKKQILEDLKRIREIIDKSG